MEEPPKIEEETKTCKVGANKHGLNHSISISTQENVPLQLEQSLPAEEGKRYIRE